ncbi:MAG: hypothetical protein QXW00_01735 [Candidatus Woesearchaeota archaeon]
MGDEKLNDNLEGKLQNDPFNEIRIYKMIDSLSKQSDIEGYLFDLIMDNNPHKKIRESYLTYVKQRVLDVLSDYVSNNNYSYESIFKMNQWCLALEHLISCFYGVKNK